MMMASDVSCLYTVSKAPLEDARSQFFRVIDDVARYELIREVMGATGLVGVHRKVVFVEGEQASLDVALYEAIYPPNQYDVEFVPASSNRVVTKIAERVNELLSAAVGFSEYYCIVDGDCDTEGIDLSTLNRLFRLPVYHVENFLLDEELMLAATRVLLGQRCRYQNHREVRETLESLVLSDRHVKSLAASYFDAKLRALSKKMEDSLFQGKPIPEDRIQFAGVLEETQGILREAVEDGTWRAKCKGKQIIKLYCHGLQISKDDHFKNLMIGMMGEAPGELERIIIKDIGVKRKRLSTPEQVVMPGDEEFVPAFRGERGGMPV